MLAFIRRCVLEENRCSWLIGEATISLINDLLIIALNMVLRNVATHICKNKSAVLTYTLDWAEYILNYEIWVKWALGTQWRKCEERERQGYLLRWTGPVEKVRLKPFTKHFSNRANRSVGKSMVCNRWSKLAISGIRMGLCKVSGSVIQAFWWRNFGLLLLLQAKSRIILKRNLEGCTFSSIT